MNTQHGGQCEERRGDEEASRREEQKTQTISNNYPQNCLELITGHHYW